MATGLQVLARVRLGPRGQGLADLHGRWEDGDTTVRVNSGRPRGSPFHPFSWPPVHSCPIP